MELGSVFITGANRGLGLAFVKHFLVLSKPPNYVFAGCRNPDNAEALKTLANSNHNLKIIKLDVANDKSIASAAQQVAAVVGDKGLNLIINNAGLMGQFDPGEADPQEMIQLYRVNALGPFLMSKAFVPLLQKAAKFNLDLQMSVQKAAIITISSHPGSITDSEKFQGLYGYRASKAAVNMLMRCLSMELIGDHILVLNFCPGYLATDMTSNLDYEYEGGTNTPEQSVAKMVKLMEKMKESDQGKFYRYNGTEIPW